MYAGHLPLLLLSAGFSRSFRQLRGSIAMRINADHHLKVASSLIGNGCNCGRLPASNPRKPSTSAREFALAKPQTTAAEPVAPASRRKAAVHVPRYTFQNSRPHFPARYNTAVVRKTSADLKCVTFCHISSHFTYESIVVLHPVQTPQMLHFTAACKRPVRQKLPASRSLRRRRSKTAVTVDWHAQSVTHAHLGFTLE